LGSADRAIVCATFPSFVTNRSRWTHNGIRCANAATLRDTMQELRTSRVTPSNTIRGLNQSPRKNPNTRLLGLSFSTQLTSASWPVTLHTAVPFIRTLPISMGDWRPYPSHFHTKEPRKRFKVQVSKSIDLRLMTNVQCCIP